MTQILQPTAAVPDAGDDRFEWATDRSWSRTATGPASNCPVPAW